MNKKLQNPAKVACPLAVAVALSVPLLTLPSALAQDTSAPTEPAKLEKMVVTGSNIQSADAAGSLTVTTVDLAEPANVGFPRVADVLRVKLPQYGGVGFVNEGFGNGGDGSSGIALRGLPASATLVLVNGRRTTAADLNLIPEAAIERVEILNDGASAIYGTDAVAGVVNIILRTDFTGLKLDAYYANTWSTDVSERKFMALWGGGNEKSKFVLSAEYSASNDQLARDRKVSGELVASTSTSNPGRFLNAAPATTHNYTNALGEVSTVVDWMPLRWSVNPNVTRGLSNVTQIASIYPGIFDPLAVADTTTATSSSQATQMRNAEEARLNALLNAATGGNSPLLYGPHQSVVPGFPGGYFPYGLWTTGYRPHEKYGASLFGEHKIFEDNLKSFVEAYYMRNKSSFFLAPSPLANRNLPTANYWLQTVFPGLAANQNLTYSYRPVEMGPREYVNDFETFHGVAGLKGQIGQSTWNWELAFLWDRVENDQRESGGVIADEYARLLGLTTADAWNPLGYTPPAGGISYVNSPATIAAFSAAATEKTVASTMGLGGKINGDVFTIPGGPGAIAAAIGAETRREKLDYEPDYAVRNGLIFPFNVIQPLKAQRDVNSVFGEVKIPVFGEDFKVPGFNALSFIAAARYEDYSDVGDTGFKPRVSFRWLPLPDSEELTIKGSYAQGYIAPGFGDLYQEPGQDFIEVMNPRTGTREQPTEAVMTIGNPHLKPEEAESWLIGFLYSPKYVKGLTVGADYYYIRQTGIPFASAAYTVQQWASYPDNAANPFGPNALPSAVNPLGAQVEFNPDGTLYQIRNVGPINSGERLTDGIDLHASQAIETDVGKFTISGQAARVITFEQEDFPGAGKIDYLGRYWGEGAALNDVGFPEWRANISLSYEYKRFNAALGWNYVSGYVENDPNTGLDRPVDDYYTFDVRLGFKIPWAETDFMFGINNLADQEPPKVYASFENGYDRRIGDIRGRMYFLSLSKTF
jgi:iron complex outermembrane receptor protein